MRLLVTGANGFIGKNLCLRLKECGFNDVVTVSRESTLLEIEAALDSVDFIFHLAGVNRPEDISEFESGNVDLIDSICHSLTSRGKQIPIVYTSSTQALLDNPYGQSKYKAELLLTEYARLTNSKVFIYRLPNVFGKWCKPNYNSVVATFCHNVARDLPIQINNPDAEVNLVYVDDVVNAFMRLMSAGDISDGLQSIGPAYTIQVGKLAELIKLFKNSRHSLLTENVGNGFMRALYATYVSYIPKECFSYEIPKYSDPRGEFCEVLKTKDSGQFSYFTAHPGVTRGGHYHHSKTEKFLVIRGTARFCFRQMISGETHEIIVDGLNTQIVETVPGWTHDITNIGHDELIVMLWANELFDKNNPDTFAEKV